MSGETIAAFMGGVAFGAMFIAFLCEYLERRYERKRLENEKIVRGIR